MNNLVKIVAIVCLLQACDKTADSTKTSESANKSSNWDESYDGVILKAVIDRGLLPNKIVKMDSVSGPILAAGTSGIKGSNVDRILFIDDSDKKSYVIKESRERPDFKREKELVETDRLAKWKEVVEDFEKEKGLKLPHFIDYLEAFTFKFRGVDSDITLMSKAPGQSLESILKEIRSSKLSEEEAVEIAKEIGEQMGNLTAAFYVKNNTFLDHGDISSDNLFYDKAFKQLTWIDMARAVEKDTKSEDDRKKARSEGKSDLFGSYLDDENNTVKYLWWYFFPFQESMEELKAIFDEKGLEGLKPFRVGVKAGTALIMAYMNSIKDLPRPKGWKNDKDSFVKTIDELFIPEFRENINKKFGPKGPEVLKYLIDDNVDLNFLADRTN